jgi:hypothetical protein
VSSRHVVAVAALLVLLAGCSEKTQGSPSPGDEPADPTTGQTTEETTTTEPGADGLATVQPCDLLDATGVASLQLTGGEELSLGGARVCEYRREGATLNESFTVAVALWDNQGLDALNASGVQQLPDIGSHKAVSFVDAAGSCGVGIGVGDTSRVDSSAVGGDQELGCQLAGQLATIVERKLP